MLPKSFFANFRNTSIVIIFIAIVTAFSHFLTRKASVSYKKFFTVVSPQIKTLEKKIDVSGFLEIKDNLKIGSLIPGTVKNIFVKEGEQVNEGHVLAIIDNGKDDCDVMALCAEVEQIEALLNYQQKHFARLQELYDEQFLAIDELEREQSKLTELSCKLKIAQAKHKKAALEFANTRIKAPKEGIIVAVRVTQGETVTATIDATVLFELATDLAAKQAVFEVEEADASWICAGQEIELSFEGNYNYTLFSKIDHISFTPRLKNGLVFFKIYAQVQDSAMRLRPGISVNGEITCARANKAMTLPGQVFDLQTTSVEKLAKHINFTPEPANTYNSKPGIKWIWKVESQKFVQQPVSVGINDQINFEVRGKIDPTDQILASIDESQLKGHL